MEYDKLKDALDGLHAYDSGCVSSGIKDELLRQQVKDHLKTLGIENPILAKITRELYLDDDKIEQGYCLSDIKQFIEWLEFKMM